MASTTNVFASDLNYDQYKTEEYDEDIQAIIPGYRELHDKISHLISSEFKRSDAPSLLELGVGTGLTGLVLLKKIPKSDYTGIDFSNKMLSGAKVKLKGYKTRFILADYADVDFGKKFDIIFSVIGIHHQTNPGKKKLFKKILSHLNKNGIFIFGDLVTYKDKKKATEMNDKTIDFLIKNAKDDKRRKEWLYHWKKLNILAPLEDQIKWLKDVGFSDVSSEYNCLNTALVLARK